MSGLTGKRVGGLDWVSLGLGSTYFYACQAKPKAWMSELEEAMGSRTRAEGRAGRGAARERNLAGGGRRFRKLSALRGQNCFSLVCTASTPR
jgi:hypothetical protein